MEFITRAPTIDLDFSDPDGRSYENNPNDWHQITSADVMIRAVVEPYSTPVGGIFYSANKAGIITPYLALVGLIGAI